MDIDEDIQNQTKSILNSWMNKLNGENTITTNTNPITKNITKNC